MPERMVDEIRNKWFCDIVQGRSFISYLKNKDKE